MSGMSEIEMLIFDLDGTLVDTRRAISDAVNYTLREMGKKELSFEKILSYIGGPLENLMEKVLETKNIEEIKKGGDIFNSYYKKNSKEKVKLYPHVKQTLQHFSHKKKALVTNASEKMAMMTLEHFKIKGYFEKIFTGDEENCVKPSACPINRTREYLKACSRNSLMIGDMAVDIEAGRKAGIKTCGVTYGIGKEEEIRKASPDFIINDIAELKDIVK